MTNIPSDWQPRETAPKFGRFLVFIPAIRNSVQMCYSPVTDNGPCLIGTRFEWDMPEWTMWHPAPEDPPL
jgi:hypothetical protein